MAKIWGCVLLLVLIGCSNGGSGGGGGGDNTGAAIHGSCTWDKTTKGLHLCIDLVGSAATPDKCKMSDDPYQISTSPCATNLRFGSCREKQGSNTENVMRFYTDSSSYSTKDEAKYYCDFVGGVYSDG